MCELHSITQHSAVNGWTNDVAFSDVDYGFECNLYVSSCLQCEFASKMDSNWIRLKKYGTNGALYNRAPAHHSDQSLLLADVEVVRDDCFDSIQLSSLTGDWFPCKNEDSGQTEEVKWRNCGSSYITAGPTLATNFQSLFYRKIGRGPFSLQQYSVHAERKSERYLMIRCASVPL